MTAFLSLSFIKDTLEQYRVRLGQSSDSLNDDIEVGYCMGV